MPAKDELHQTIRGGGRVLIRQVHVIARAW
jgi:hypothetical protein